MVKILPFAPKAGVARNFLGALEDMLGAENHYLEFAVLYPDDADFWLRMMDDARMIRQRLVLSVKWNTRSWCQLKHLLHAGANLREAIQKAFRQGMETKELLKCLNLLSKLIKRQVEKMYEV